MRPLLLIAVGLVTGTAALGAELSFYDGDGDGSPDVLIPDSAWPAWLERGTGSPSLTYDDAAGQWVMYFEARFTQDYLDASGEDWSHCQNIADGPKVVWGIGRATSTDGLTGWRVDGEPIVMPQPGTWRSCSTSHPFVVNAEGTYHLYFKAEQGFDPCPDGSPEPTWGCGRMTGVGYASSEDGDRFEVNDSEDPLITITSFGFPTAAAFQATDAAEDDIGWAMLLTRADGVYLAESADAGGAWALETSNPVLVPGTWLFAQDEWFQPTLVCNPEGDTFRYTAWIGGRNVASGDSIDAIKSVDGLEWVGDGSPDISFADTEAWRHWDATQIGDDTYFFYTIRGDDQKLRVSLAKFGEDDSIDLDGSQLTGRACLYGERPDPDPTDNTDNTDNTDATDDTDVEEPGCYCSTGGNPATWPLAAGVLLLGLLRRRRR